MKDIGNTVTGFDTTPINMKLRELKEKAEEVGKEFFTGENGGLHFMSSWAHGIGEGAQKFSKDVMDKHFPTLRVAAQDMETGATEAGEYVAQKFTDLTSDIEKEGQQLMQDIHSLVEQHSHPDGVLHSIGEHLNPNNWFDNAPQNNV